MTAMDNKEHAERIIRLRGFTDHKWLAPRDDIIVAQWVRFRCQFGCGDYGKTGSCPPAAPSVDECRNMIYEYANAVIIHFNMRSPSPDDKYKSMSELLDLEREIFLAGYYKTFLLQYADCCFCDPCVSGGFREKCVNKTKCRPSVDAMGIDMFQTARNAGYHIEVLQNRNDIQDRFAILLVD